MDDGAIAALVGVVVGGAIAALSQYANTRQVLAADRDRRKKDRLLEVVSQLVELSDPEAHMPPDHAKVAPLISKAQLLLDLRVPNDRALNAALTELGLGVQRYLSKPDDGSLASLLNANGKVIDLAKHVVQ